VEHAVDVVADERDQHHCCYCSRNCWFFFEFGKNFALGQRSSGGSRIRWRELAASGLRSSGQCRGPVDGTAQGRRSTSGGEIRWRELRAADRVGGGGGGLAAEGRETRAKAMGFLKSPPYAEFL
jgi:hypothetical protein